MYVSEAIKSTEPTRATKQCWQIIQKEKYSERLLVESNRWLAC